MTERIIFAGFGGQGVLLAGKLLCIAAMKHGKHVSHIPSYGAEMRGGTANCAVVISNEEIPSPLVFNPSVCVVLNNPSLLKFEPRIIPGGLLLYNSSLIEQKPAREDITKIAVPVNDIAEKAGSVKTANMVAIGSLLKIKQHLASLDAAIAALDKAVSSRHKALNKINIKALQMGFESIKNNLTN